MAGSAAEQILGIGLELVQGRQKFIAAEQFDRRRHGGAIDRVAAQQCPQLHDRHLIPGPVPGIDGVCVVGAEGDVLPAIGSRGRYRPAKAGRAGGITAACGGGRTAAGRPGGSAAGFNAEQALQLGQLLKQGADRLQQGAAASSGLGGGGVCGHGCAASELQGFREALNEAQAIACGRLRQSQPVLSARQTAHLCVALASMPLDQRPKPISTGIPSLDLDMRGGVIPGKGEGTWVLAARSGIGKTTVAIAAAMGLACNGASLLVLSCELTREAILARLMANYCRRAMGMAAPLYSTSDLEGRGRLIAGEDLERLERWHASFEAGCQPNGQPMGEVLYESRFGATVEDVCALVEDSKSAHPDLSVVVLDHFHAMGSSPGYGPNTTAELAARAMALKALAGRCDLDILIVAQLNRGAYGSPSGPDVSHLAGTSELERYASAVWLIDRPKPGDGPPPAKGVLEVHHGKFRHGQPSDLDLSRTVIRIDRAHCYLEADEARLAFCGSQLYPGVEVP